MTKLYLIGLYSIYSIYCISNIRADSFFDDDDSLNESNSMINIDVYKNYIDCSNKIDIVYKYRKNFYLECNCINIHNCYNKLKESNKLNYYSFDYNNKSFELNVFNFTKQCYTINGLYIYNELNVYDYCISSMVLFIGMMILFVFCLIININYFISIQQKKRYQHTIHPPLYQAIN